MYIYILILNSNYQKSYDENQRWDLPAPPFLWSNLYF